ncbi:PRC-barrel domain-containing protein [Deinococcus deserti]|uniref:PRC-barrel domain-containing protein n=1 Tax=Deinococcus deserti (strain DSM 17065 / CIP 109153 / LMG 22923 / VCD115) TaxID=546414 RepID=C1D1D7_DEIDV|nr:PRC-barrel domain-containing protein [Deinococcus deserti]ACO45661.1 hypothetical protein Deide_07970 [Deinococcus deserti VCD115]
MIKGKEILGKNIVAISTGQRVESVRDVIFDHQANQVLGLLVDEGGWFRAARVLPFERIRSFGEDALMIQDAGDLTTTREDGRLADVLESNTNLIGMTLLTTDGQDLGRIADVLFDERTGRVEGYEATGGLFSDLSNGRTFVPAPEGVQIGIDTAIVPVEVANAMREQEGGQSAYPPLYGVAETRHPGASGSREGAVPADVAPRVNGSPDGRVVQVYSPSRSPASPPADLDARQSLSEASADSRQASNLTVQGQSEAAAQGRRVKRDVRTPGGHLLAVQGQIVTPTVLSRARDMGVTPELVAATQDDHSQTAGAAGEGAGHLLDRARQWFNDRREETEAAIQERQVAEQEQRIREALGRPVNRVILAPDDSVILNIGEIITHRAVQSARDAGVLDILLGSVSKENVSIDPLSTRPSEPGQAALESRNLLEPRQD